MPTKQFVAHHRLSLNGSLPNSEQFSCNLSLELTNTGTTAFLDWLAASFNSTTLSQNNFDAMVTAAEAYWARATTDISPFAVLKLVKLAPINPNGTYAGPPKEAAVSVAGGSVGEFLYPLQMSRKVTFETDGDLARVKGGFYLPGCTSNQFNSLTDLYDASETSDVRDSTATFIGDLNDAPGWDDTGGQKVVVASQGRYRNGVQTVPPTNWEVKRVNVGRRIDVQRRRANKISEARITDATL